MRRVVVIFLIVLGLAMGLSACASIKYMDVSDNPYLVLVNKTNKLPSDWEETVDIDTVENSFGEELKVEHRTYEAFQQLRSELLGYGIQIELDSAYRSVEEQQEIWDAWSADPDLGESYCQKYLAVPGYSEHHTGLAIDIFIVKDGRIIRDNEALLADEEDFAVVHELMPQYGFILRYPKGEETVTGYAYEPWHMRYIDDVSLAQGLTDEGLTLEEFLS